MIQYIYFVKCPNCEDEPFDFFDEAKAYALGCLSKKPAITQIEVDRNDFGECTSSNDLGTIWSYEDEVQLTDEPVALTKDCLGKYDPDNDPEFQDDIFFTINNVEESLVTEDFDFNRAAAQCSRNCYDFYKAIASKAPQREINKFGKTAYKFVKDQYGLVDDEAEDLLWRGYSIWKQLHEDTNESGDRKPIPADMTIEQLVEAMEENEDTVECVCCQELYPKEDCKYDEKHGWICPDCIDEVVECTWCEELYARSQCRYEVDLGWLCGRCQAAIMSRGEPLTFRENTYWNFLEEDTAAKDRVWICVFDGHEVGTVTAKTEDEAVEKMQHEYPEYPYGIYDGCFDVFPEEDDDETDVTSLSESSHKYNDTVELEYEDFDDSYGPSTYTYRVERSAVIEYLCDQALDKLSDKEVQELLKLSKPPYEYDDEEYFQAVDNNFDEVFKKFEGDIYEYFREACIEEYYSHDWEEIAYEQAMEFQWECDNDR